MSGIHARVSLRTDRFVSCVRFYPRIRSSEVVELMRRAEPGDENLSMRSSHVRVFCIDQSSASAV